MSTQETTALHVPRHAPPGGGGDCGEKKSGSWGTRADWPRGHPVRPTRADTELYAGLDSRVEWDGATGMLA